MEAFGKLVFALIIVAFACIIGGYVFVVLWRWFIVSTFHLQPLTIAQAIGLNLIIAYMKSPIKNDNEDLSFKDVVIKIFSAIFSAALMLLFGWLIFQFI